MPREKTFDIDSALDDAMKLFWANGYEATSMQTILHEMGINRGSFYATYGDKRSLFLAALNRYDDLYRRERLAALEKSHPPLKAIEALFDGWVRTIVADPEQDVVLQLQGVIHEQPIDTGRGVERNGVAPTEGDHHIVGHTWDRIGGPVVGIFPSYAVTAFVPEQGAVGEEQG